MHTMSMRLDDEDTARLRELSETTRQTNNDVLRVALREYHERQMHRGRVRAAMQESLAENASLLQRLAEA